MRELFKETDTAPRLESTVLTRDDYESADKGDVMGQPPQGPPGSTPKGPPITGSLGSTPPSFVTAALPPGGQPERALPMLKSFINDQRVLGSGTVVVTRDDVLKVVIEHLTFEFRFADNGGEEGAVESAQVSPTYVAVTLRNFANPLGTALGPVTVGTLNYRPLILGVYVEGVSDRIRVVTYCFYEGSAR